MVSPPADDRLLLLLNSENEQPICKVLADRLLISGR